ncbi:MAG: hypothetical protein JWP29_645 [Rhodoferax sp.]|nr:hypothetical protein [Rhodoferax sp.]
MVWMTAFHFCFDLQHFGYTRQDFYADPFWTWQRTAIVSLFLFCAGLGQGVAAAQGQSWLRFWRRWRLVAGCALLVTAASYFMFPQSFIYFGVLHGLAVMLLIARLTARWGRWLWLLGALAVGSKFAAEWVLTGSPAAVWFNGRSLNWLGWISVKPFTEDYVPVFPWLGVVWWGVALGTALQRRAGRLLRFASAPLVKMRGLASVGRWSLVYYMLHQPVLIGLLTAYGAVFASGRP